MKSLKTLLQESVVNEAVGNPATNNVKRIYNLFKCEKPMFLDKTSSGYLSSEFKKFSSKEQAQEFADLIYDQLGIKLIVRKNNREDTGFAVIVPFSQDTDVIPWEYKDGNFFFTWDDNIPTQFDKFVKDNRIKLKYF